MNKKECTNCNEIMECEGMDEDEPLLVYRCPRCKNIEYERLNGYEG